MTLLSRIMGFVRDTLVAQIYGVSASVDAFNVAWKIPNFMRNLFAEGCFSQAFVPVLAEYKSQRPVEDVQRFTRNIAGVLGIVLLVITVLGIVGAPFLIKLFAPGYAETDPRFTMASDMLRITFPYLMLISLTAFGSAILNTYGRFAIPAFTPVLLNVCLIAAALWLSSYFDIPVEAQAWGVCTAGFIQLAFQFPFLYRIGFLATPKLDWKDPGVRRVMILMLPALFGASIGQISLLINTIFASFLKVGSISWLYFSERLAYFPLGVVGVALATVVLPHLSSRHAEKSPVAFAQTLDWGVRCNLLVGIPAAVVLIALAEPLIITLFYYRKFTVYDVLMTKQSLIAYAVGLVAFMLVKVLSTGFYARQDVRTPVKLGIITVVVNIVLNAALVYPLAHAGLALAASIASWVNVGLLFFFLYRQSIYIASPGWGLFIIRQVIANAVMAASLLWFVGDIQQWLAWDWLHRLAYGTFLGIGGMLIYAGVLLLTGFRWKDMRLQV